jgi:hypothetical protein
MKRMIVLAGLAACSDCAHPPAVIQNVAPPSAPDRAYVADASGIVEVDPATRAATVIAQGGAWCSVDARARVLWFMSGDGLSAFDLATRKTSLVVKGDFGEIQPIIDWGNERVGGESGLSYATGLQIAMTAKPTAKVVVGCVGDAKIMCFEDDLKTVRPKIVQERRFAHTLQLVDPGLVAALAARGAGRSLWLPAPTQAPPKPPAVPKDECENPDLCGLIEAVPGTSLWLVLTGNGRGDYFHETRELWDPSTGEYLRVTPAGVRRTTSIPDPHTPDGSTDYGGLRISPAGLSHNGFVFDTQRVIYAPKEHGQTCGWASGGWRVPGPMDGVSDAPTPEADALP